MPVNHSRRETIFVTPSAHRRIDRPARSGDGVRQWPPRVDDRNGGWSDVGRLHGNDAARPARAWQNAVQGAYARLYRRDGLHDPTVRRSEEHTSELQSLMRISYAVFCLTQNKKQKSSHSKINTPYTLHQ